MPAGGTVDDQFRNRADEAWQIILLKVPLRFRHRRKRLGRFVAQRRERGHFARVFFPFLDLRRISHDLDLALVIGKAHATAETLLVQISETTLIIVMIGRAEKRSAQSAARDVGEISLDRLGLGDLDFVKIVLSKTKCVALEKLSIDRDSAISAKLIKRRVGRG